MSEIADARINSFGITSPKADLVQPEEEPIFVLTGSQLQEIIERSIERATEPLYREIALDRQRIARLEQSKPGPLQKDRGDILRALLAANGGKMLAKDARKKMRLSEATFSVLLSTMKDCVETKPYHLNKSWKVLILK
jgi:uncharacterized membrane protein